MVFLLALCVHFCNNRNTNSTIMFYINMYISTRMGSQEVLILMIDSTLLLYQYFLNDPCLYYIHVISICNRFLYVRQVLTIQLCEKNEVSDWYIFIFELQDLL